MLNVLWGSTQRRIIQGFVGHGNCTPNAMGNVIFFFFKAGVIWLYLLTKNILAVSQWKQEWMHGNPLQLNRREGCWLGRCNGSKEGCMPYVCFGNGSRTLCWIGIGRWERERCQGSFLCEWLNQLSGYRCLLLTKSLQDDQVCEYETRCGK